jgi:hypothetical protein
MEVVVDGLWGEGTSLMVTLHPLPGSGPPTNDDIRPESPQKSLV